MDKILLLFAVATLCPATTFSSCSFPPEFWCSSKDIAASCGVSTQCGPWLEEPVKTIHSYSNNNNDDVDEKRRLLDLTILYEVLCPDCQEFILDQVALAISELGAEFWTHVKLTLFPFGNAEESFDPKSDRYVFRCQHGPTECLGNLIHTCAMNHCGNDAPKWFPFVHCMELKSREAAKRRPAIAYENRITDDDMTKFGAQCAGKTKLNWTEIHECTTGWRGNLLQHAVAKATAKHQYVPWVIVNGRHTEKIQDDAEKNLLKLICRFIRHPKPFACYKRSNGEGATRCYVKTPFHS